MQRTHRTDRLTISPEQATPEQKARYRDAEDFVADICDHLPGQWTWQPDHRERSWCPSWVDVRRVDDDVKLCFRFTRKRDGGSTIDGDVVSVGLAVEWGHVPARHEPAAKKRTNASITREPQAIARQIERQILTEAGLAAHAEALEAGRRIADSKARLRHTIGCIRERYGAAADSRGENEVFVYSTGHLQGRRVTMEVAGDKIELNARNLPLELTFQIVDAIIEHDLERAADAA